MAADSVGHALCPDLSSIAILCPKQAKLLYFVPLLGSNPLLPQSWPLSLPASLLVSLRPCV